MLGEEYLINSGNQKTSLPDMLSKINTQTELKNLIPSITHKRQFKSKKKVGLTNRSWV